VGLGQDGLGSITTDSPLMRVHAVLMRQRSQAMGQSGGILDLILVTTASVA